MPTCDLRYPDGTLWLHIWEYPIPPGHGYSALCMAVESVGSPITETPYVLVTPIWARHIVRQLSSLPGVVVHATGVSLRLDGEVF